MNECQPRASYHPSKQSEVDLTQQAVKHSQHPMNSAKAYNLPFVNCNVLFIQSSDSTTWKLFPDCSGFVLQMEVS